MKTGGASGKFISPLVKALEGAGYELVRRNSSHFIFHSPDHQKVAVPQRLDSVGVAKRIARTAGVSL